MKKSEKPGVMLYFETAEATTQLDLETKGRLYECIMEYGLYGTVPELSGPLVYIWPFVKQKIDFDNDRYQDIQEKRARAGSRGGQAKANNAKQSEANLAIATFAKDEVAEESKDSNTKQIKPTPTPTPTPTTTPTTTPTPSDIYQPSTNNQPGTINEGSCMGALNGPTTTRQRFTPPSADDVRAYATEKGYTIDPEAFVDYYIANGWKVGKNPMKDWKAAVRTWVRKDNEHGRNSDSKRNNIVPENPPIRLNPKYVL